MIGDTVGDDRKEKDEASTCSSGNQKSSLEDGVGRSSFSLSSTTEGDETVTKKKLPRVILRLGKPPDLPV